jgi:RIO kinase 2
MKLDATVMRTMERSDFLLLEAVESAMKDHYIVPLNVIAATAQLRHGGVQTVLRGLLRDKLLSHERKGGREGFRLTNSGYDILALYHLKKRNVIAALGQKIGTGKESDIYLAATPAGQQIVLKFHRLGRTSFRNVKQKRDYIRPTTSSSGSGGGGMMSQHSWLFLSKLSAAKEWSFLSALHKVQYPTPTPLAHNRHVIAMSLVRGTPLYQIYPKTVSADQAAAIYQQVAAMAARLAQVHGLVHCDLNEFNLLVDLSGIQSLATDDTNDAYVRHSGYSVVDPKSIRSEGILSKPAWEQSLLEQHGANAAVASSEPLPEPKERLANGEPMPVVTLIDFPQMISTQHPNAQELFERDMDCLQRFFETKLKCPVPETDQVRWDDIMAARRRRGRTCDDDNEDDGKDGAYEDVSERLDRELRASGISLHDNQQLELYYFESGLKPIASAVDVVEEEEEQDDYDDESASSSDNVDSGAPLDDSTKRQEEDSPQRHANMVMIDTSAAAALHGPARHDGNTISGEGSAAAHTRSSIRTLTREELQVIAQERVQKQLGDQKRKARLRGAYRKQNSNKNYGKGRRVVAESLAM